MRFRIVFALSIAVGSLVAGTAHGQSNPPAMLIPGLWEISVQTRSPIVGPVLTHSVCIDKAHVARPEPPKSKPTDDCQISLQPAAANETTYSMRCTKRNMSSTSHFTYSGDHYDGTVIITTKTAEIHQVFTAKRISDCTDLPDLTSPPPAH